MKLGFVNRILIAVLASLGFASCEPEQPEHSDMYGCPITDYNEVSSVTAEPDCGDTVAVENTENEKE